MEGSRDDGFTLAELLVVIVILGILSTVSVFAVRGITSRGSESACATELDTLVTAQELHYGFHGSYGDEASLVANGFIRQSSSLYDASGDTSGYAIASAAGSACTAGTSGGGAAAAPAAAMTGSSVTFHGAAAFRYPNGGGGNDEILVLGRAGGRNDWIAASNAGEVTTRRVHFIDMDDLSAASLNTVLTQMRNNGVTDIAYYPGDDSTNLAGTAGNVGAFLTPIAGANADVTLRTMNGGFDLADLFAITG